MRKFISIILCVVIICATFSTSYSAIAEEKCDCQNSPIVYIIGRTDIYDNVKSPDRKSIPDISMDSIVPIITDLIPYGMAAVYLNQWERFDKVAFKKFYPLFKDYVINPDATITNDSGVLYTWSEKNLSPNHNTDNPYTYHFEYDARFSPMVIADDLNEYIEAVKRVTRHDKVSIISRCVGCNYAFAYIQKYQEPIDFAGLDKVILYDSALDGIESIEDGFSGNIHFDEENVGLFASHYKLKTGNETIDKIIPVTVEMLRNTYGIKITAASCQNFYDHIRNTFMVEIMRNSFGTSPGWFSMVNERFEEAKKYIFCKEGDSETYSVILKQIDDFHYNVQLRATEIIKKMQENGVDVFAICKYGYGTLPFTSRNAYLNDDCIGLEKQSYGATCSKVESKLDKNYIDERVKAGYEKYISPDGQIDASTALLPDKTWYIKYYPHNNFYDTMNPLLNLICRTDNMTVDTYEEWGQFLILQNLYYPTAMTKENCDPDNVIRQDEAKKSNIFTHIAAIIKWNNKMLKILFEYLSNK